MLGNFSFGDYFKKEAIDWAWEFLTEDLGIPPERLWITIFEGDEDAPEDLEAKELWMDVGVPEHKIFGLPKSENWWGPPGDSGPCGPCSEIYYDYGEEFAHGDPARRPEVRPRRRTKATRASWRSGTSSSTSTNSARTAP